MADTHGHNPAPHADDDRHADDAHDAAPEEDAVRTPLWLTLVGIALLLAGVLGVYLFVSPGRLSGSSAEEDAAGDAGAGDAAAPAGGAEAGAAARPAPPAGAAAQPAPGGGGVQIVPQIVEPAAH